jgi:hypothetical protein
MLGLSGTAVVKAIKAERPVSTLSGSSFAPAEFTPVTLSRPSGAEFSSWKPTLAGTSIRDPSETFILLYANGSNAPPSQSLP